MLQGSCDWWQRLVCQARAVQLEYGEREEHGSLRTAQRMKHNNNFNNNNKSVTHKYITVLFYFHHETKLQEMTCLLINRYKETDGK